MAMLRGVISLWSMLIYSREESHRERACSSRARRKRIRRRRISIIALYMEMSAFLHRIAASVSSTKAPNSLLKSRRRARALFGRGIVAPAASKSSLALISYTYRMTTCAPVTIGHAASERLLYISGLA